MKNIRKIAKEHGRSLPWIAKNKFGITRQGLYFKIDTNTWRDGERKLLADELGVPYAELFPDGTEAQP